MTSSSLTVNVGGNLSYTLMDLQVETDYTVTVTATNECGDESPPSTITVRIDSVPASNLNEYCMLKLVLACLFRHYASL